MPTWRDEQLPPDETLRVLAGGEPSWGFKIKRAALWLWGGLLALATWLFVLFIFVAYQGRDRWVVLVLCTICLLVGFVAGIKACRSRE